MRAAEYPFGRAAGSFHLHGGEALPGRADVLPPLLAYGANASPEVLARKLPGVPVAALAGRLHGWAVVHSAHVSPYGAVPATIVRSAGAVAAVHVLLIAGAAATAALDATEPNYDPVRLDGLALEADRVGALDTADAYVSKWGPLLARGRPVALGARPQAELLALVAGGA